MASVGIIRLSLLERKTDVCEHGIPRTAGRGDRTEAAKQKEIKDIQAYQQLVEDINRKVAAKEFTPELLDKTAELLKRNPEYYTIWNCRRRIYAAEFEHLRSSSDVDDEKRTSETLDIIRMDLQFLLPMLIKFPKCYWIWNHRLWLLEQASLLLPAETSLRLWREELGLVGKMLTRDGRNFHGWGYRRMVVNNIERLQATSIAKKEFEYTTKMITADLSNFSAWHNRSKLIIRFLEEQQASDEERKQILDEELALIHKALFDPYDQSLWFYHQNLVCTFDAQLASKTMAPNLDDHQRKDYISAEREFVEEVLEDATDCKWVYQALIELALLEQKLDNSLKQAQRERMLEWVEQLMKLDPLRKGRWQDLEKIIKAF